MRLLFQIEGKLDEATKDYESRVNWFGKDNKEDTLRDMLDHKVHSQKSSSDSSNLSATSQISIQSLNNRGLILPEPLPLFDGPAEDEPNLLQGFRRATKIFKSASSPDGQSTYCPHEEIADWTCRVCKKRLP